MKEIVLRNGMVAMVDDEDFIRCSQYKWHAERSGATYYAHRHETLHHAERMHQFIMGKAPAGMEIDHIDFNGLNNQRSNLRIVTHQENMKNCRKKIKSSSKYPYVSWHKRDKRWQVVLTINGKQTHLGHFINEDDAARRAQEVIDASRQRKGMIAAS